VLTLGSAGHQLGVYPGVTVSIIHSFGEQKEKMFSSIVIDGGNKLYVLVLGESCVKGG
jgi:hypothetical protein